ncbi:MAG: phosphatase PAP2 family protein [Bacteroidota bacterium]
MKMHLILTVFVLSSVFAFAQRKPKIVYQPRFGLDMPLMIGVGAGLGVAQFQLRQIEAPTIAEIALLDPMDISSFDRGATSNWSTTADTWSIVSSSVTMAAPLLLFLDEKIRQDYQTIWLLGVESFLISDVLGQLLAVNTKRNRPFLYNDDSSIPEATLLDRRARTSFFSRQTAYASALSFMTAKVYIDYHPKAKHKWLFWSAAALLPAVTGYLRYQSGEEFPTDIIGGYLVGASVGYLVPAIHKVKDKKSKKVNNRVSMADPFL